MYVEMRREYNKSEQNKCTQNHYRKIKLKKIVQVILERQKREENRKKRGDRK